MIVQQLKLNQCTVKGKPLEERKPGYRRFKDGGIECFNREEVRAQEGLVVDLMRSAGKQLMEGKNIISVSLPVRIFEPRSMIERICDWWSFMPIYFRMAARTNDPVERMKLVITMAISGLYNGSKQKKPFNPILGETFQGHWQDGTEIFIEHTSHHPPVSHFLVSYQYFTNYKILDGEKQFKFHGHYEYQAALRYNAVVGRQEGPSVVQFSDGQTIKYNLPAARVNGLLFGSRVTDWFDTFKFMDEKNGLICEIKFSEGAGVLLGRSAQPTDCFEQNLMLYLFYQKNSGTLFQHDRIASKLQGSWLDYVAWDNQKYWSIELIDPAILQKVYESLPSDCRYRTDLIELSRSDLDKAQEEKTRLEVIQRRDRKLRHDFKEKQH